MAQPEGKYSLEPIYDGKSYEDDPKIRGIIWSLIIALFCWIIASLFVSVFLFCLGQCWIYLMDGHFYKHHFYKHTELHAVFGIFVFSMLWEFVGHGTMLAGFWCARTWPSLTKVILYSIFGSRYARSGVSVTKISMMTD